jgi:hypothetical protein
VAATPPAPIVDASNFVKPPEFVTTPINSSQTVVDAAGNVTTVPVPASVPAPAPTALRGNYSFVSDPAASAAAPTPVAEAVPETFSTNPADYEDF